MRYYFKRQLYLLIFLFGFSIAYSQESATIKPVATGPFTINQAFWVEVKIGDPQPVIDLYGISFKLKSKNATLSYVDGSAVAGPFLGASPLSFFQKFDAQTVDIAVTKTSAPGVDGSGIIAKAQFVTSVSGTDTMMLTDISAIDRNGNTILLNDFILAIAVSGIEIPRQTTIKPVATGPFTINQAFWVEVKIGDPQPVIDLYGISFKLKSKNATLSYVDGSAVAGPFLGASPLSFFQKFDAQTVDIAVTKTSAPGVDGSGVVAKAQFMASVSRADTLILTDISAVDRNGNTIPLSDSILVVSVAGGKIPILVLSSTTVDVGQVKLGEFKDTTVTISNTGNDTLKITSITSTNSVFNASLKVKNIAPGESFQDTLRFTPSALGSVTGKILITSNDLTTPDTLFLSGNGTPTGVERLQTEIPTVFSLSQNYPNPFNPSTTISFGFTARSFVSLKVFDLLGREVATLVSEELSTGNYTKQWYASGIPSGIYFYRLQVGSFTETKKLILMK